MSGRESAFFNPPQGSHVADAKSACQSLDTIFCNSVPVIQPENEQVELTIAPNPAHSFVTLLLESEGSGNKPVRFSVFNALGQEVWTLTSGAGRQEISLAGWPPGVYVARAEWERGAAVKTFVKE
ncbi:MAG: hypothetical protein OHK0019_14480 [Saprospiraceae bacterium]